MDRTVFRVLPQGDEWVLRQGDAVLATCGHKDDAVHQGRAVARDHQPSQLVIHDSHGRIEDEATYRDDPYPPQG